MTTTDTQAGLLRAICERPHDMGLRLIYADWLEELGMEKRAEFLRLQLRLAELDAKGLTCTDDCVARWNTAKEYRLFVWCPSCAEKRQLRQRETELLKSNIGAWTDFLPEEMVVQACNNCIDGSPDLETNVVECRQCESTGIVYCYDCVEFRRGFVESISCTCADWLAHGRDIIRQTPVLRVELADKRPMRWSVDSGSGTMDYLDTYSWIDNRKSLSYGDNQSRLPPEIYELLNEPEHRNSKLYGSLRSAMDDLSRACIQWARDAAGLPRWEGT